MALNLLQLPLEILYLIIEYLPISSLCSLSGTCRLLNSNKFLICAIDAYIASDIHGILLGVALTGPPATMRRCLDIDRATPKGFLHLLAHKGLA
ncbi:uncharacterized protein LAJ45_11321 [Morchella importuna]|uniref:uncharacterized protein n=1 Tax=Morchella importuna TaxID=1174673 RepID=UPI001E8E4F74|nr:uncharacterized protein LAJ45_11321 [Morchella importuna]KAH8144660.1 hypothetical protein LAJ45_11321 [Morchella importuna]